MALVTGPLHSFEAHGQIGQTLIYEEWNGRCYVKAYAIPTLRRVPAQRAVRAINQFLTDQWKNAPPVLKPTWEALGVKAGTSGIAEFCRYNFERVWTGQGPSISYPGSEGIPTKLLQTFVVTGGVGYVDVEAGWASAGYNWAIIVYSVPTARMPTPKEIVAIFQPGVYPSTETFQVNNVEPGVHQYYYRRVGISGTINVTIGGPYPATVT
ncbi:MAG TPA: hypothetical protein VMY42_28180 [Thermoguttaceae bacterium]|nr:hypothetical protein [Thermoguttaceae bacterium]